MITPTRPPYPPALYAPLGRDLHADILRERERIAAKAEQDRKFARTPSKGLDIKGNRKPQSTVYVNGKTIYFTLYRKSLWGHGVTRIGEWSPITRKMKKTPQRVAMVQRVLEQRDVISGAETPGTDAQDNRPTPPKECNYCRRMGGVKPVVIGIDTHFLHDRCIAKFKRQTLGLREVNHA